MAQHVSGSNACLTWGRGLNFRLWRPRHSEGWAQKRKCAEFWSTVNKTNKQADGWHWSGAPTLKRSLRAQNHPRPHTCSRVRYLSTVAYVRNRYFILHNSVEKKTRSINKKEKKKKSAVLYGLPKKTKETTKRGKWGDTILSGSLRMSSFYLLAFTFSLFSISELCINDLLTPQRRNLISHAARKIFLNSCFVSPHIFPTV